MSDIDIRFYIDGSENCDFSVTSPCVPRIGDHVEYRFEAHDKERWMADSLAHNEEISYKVFEVTDVRHLVRRNSVFVTIHQANVYLKPVA